MNDDSLRAVLEKCAYEGELWKPDELLPMQNIAQELYDALASALARLDEYEQSFRLYDDACHRGTKMWQEATGNKHVYPDTAKLVAWLLAHLEAAERDLSRACYLLDQAGRMIGWSEEVERFLNPDTGEETPHD